METISIKSADSTRVGIWEVNEDHPDGEIFVSGDEVVEVAKTSKVNNALARGLIVEVEPEPIVEVEPKTRKRQPAGE